VKGTPVQQSRKRKAAKPGGPIERDAVVRAAIRLLDAQGLQGVSTRRLAEQLGISGPSLYWHFENKRELLDHMAEAMLADALPSPDPAVAEPDWRKWLTIAARAIRRAMVSHRDGAAVIAGSRPTGKHPTLNRPAMVARLRDEGFGDKAGHVLRSVMRYALGAAVSEQSALEREGVRISDASFEFGLAALIRGFEPDLKPRKRASVK
jgi:TetR/AcrR family tetracycline transcriptional repressor